MSAEITTLSAFKDQNRIAEPRPIEFGSANSRSDRFLSASKSVKAFQDSLRKYDSLAGKVEEPISPLRKKLSFGKIDCNSQQSDRLYLVDIKKKIKKVESPFKKVQSLAHSEEKYQGCQTNMLISSFHSIPQKIEELIQSSAELQKIKHIDDQILFKNITMEIEQVIQNIKLEDQFEEESQIQGICLEKMDFEISQDIKQEYIQENQNVFTLEKYQKKARISENEIIQSSENISSKSRSSEAIRLRRKNKKRAIRKEKRKIAKSMRLKLENITNFVDQLHEKQTHSDRKELILEMTRHLCQKKFDRLRNELKKLL